jgi:hypothetical protein
MLKIQRSKDQRVIFSLSGRIEAEGLEELQRVISLEAGEEIVLDLKDVGLVDRDAVIFLSRCEADNIKLENCPAYIRKWIESEEGQNSGHR